MTRVDPNENTRLHTYHIERRSGRRPFLKKTRESTNDRNSHPMARVDHNESTRLNTYPVNIIKKLNFSEDG